MVEKKIIVKNKTGIHARPASELVKECSRFKSDVFINTDNEKINAKSILNVISAGILQGTKITLCTEGEDEEEALETISSLIDNLID